MVPPPGAGQVSSSIYGRCKSSSVSSGIPAFIFNSETLPMHSNTSGFLSLCQIGSGVPQYRCLDIAQSTLFSSQVPNLPVPVLLGFQLIVLLSSTIRSFTAVVLMNQDSTG